MKLKLVVSIALFGIVLTTNAQDETINGTLTVTKNISQAQKPSTILKLGTANGVWDKNNGPAIEFSTNVGLAKIAGVDERHNNTDKFKGGLVFKTRSGNQSNDVGYYERMRITNYGYIGIGTTSPTEKLDVKGLIKIQIANDQDNNSPGLVLNSNDDFMYNDEYINNYGFGFHDKKVNTVPSTYVAGYGGVNFFTKFRNRLRIDLDGNVGIGTTDMNPNYKLSVNGKIRAKEITVETGWADFVFEADYKLPSLEEVAQHINEKGHLKDIPSEKEVLKNGVSLGQMDAKLLQKIEELTLYILQMNERINELEKENSNLKVQK